MLESAGVIYVDPSSRKDKVYMRKTTKCASLLLAVVQAAMLVASGITPSFFVFIFPASRYENLKVFTVALAR